ncbi:MAG: hypothetical protein WBH31_02570 [Promethearchaeia archaeon]
MIKDKIEKSIESSEKFLQSKDIRPHFGLITFSEFFRKSKSKDIYYGNEKIPFRNRHPIFKSLLRIEFEDAIREYLEIK